MKYNIAVYLVNHGVQGWNASSADITFLQEKLPDFKISNAKTSDEFIKLLETADVALTWNYKDEWVEKFPNVRVIGTPAAGADYLPSNLGGDVVVIRGEFHGYTMSETAIGMMLDHTRRIQEGNYRMNHGEAWPREKLALRLRNLSGSHVAILGFGSIGMITAKRLKAFDCRITGVKRNIGTTPDFFGEEDRVISVDSLYEILPTVDHIVSFLPENEDTNDLIDLKVFELLPDHAGLYSLGRGNSISEVDLIYALRSNLISGAYLDVFKDEPLSIDSPLRGVDNLYLLPHASAVSPEYMSLFFNELPEKILSVFN